MRSIFYPRDYRILLTTQFRSVVAATLAISMVASIAQADTQVEASDGVTYTLVDGQVIEPLERFQECAVCPEMIVMPMGSFMMGAIEGESRNPFDFYGENATGTKRRPDEINIIPNEHPRHQVEIDIPFAIGRNEVTHAEWMACVGEGACSHNPDHRALTPQGHAILGPDHPVVDVSYLDILEYISWLNARVGVDVYRLPTEAEWEYAARAGTTTRFAQGDELTAAQANFSRRATENIRRGQFMPQLVDRDAPVPVEELDASNQWGLRHMSGNVREYTGSCWTDRHLELNKSSSYLEDVASRNRCERRVAKGGANGSAMDALRPASRNRPTEDARRDHLGFRLIRQLTSE